MPSLEEVMKSVNKEFKSDVCKVGIEYPDVRRIPFSSPKLNYMTYGGLPVGRIVEFAGEEGGGKTSTALDIVAHAQKMFPDKKVLYIDVERTLDAEWAEKLGVDTESLILLSPEEQSAEQIFEACIHLVDTGEVSVAVVDSLAAMVSDLDYSKTMQERTYGGISQALTKFSKKMIPICARTECVLIGINQVREDMNSMYGGTITTGGRAWRHNCSVRMEFRKSDYLDDKGNSLSRSCENPAGHLVKVALTKSKVCKLDRKIATYTLKYLEGIDYVSDTIELAIRLGVINAAGAWFSLVNTETGEILEKDGNVLKFQGKSKVKEFLLNNSDIFETLSNSVLALLSKN